MCEPVVHHGQDTGVAQQHFVHAASCRVAFIGGEYVAIQQTTYVRQRLSKAVSGGQCIGMQICIVTGSGQRPLIKRLIDDFNEFIDEDHVVTAYDVERGKPYPDPYLMGLRKAGGLQPWEGIVVENAPLGVRAGVAANIFTVAVNSGPLPDSTLLDEGANLLYKRMTELCVDWEQLLSDARTTDI